MEGCALDLSSSENLILELPFVNAGINYWATWICGNFWLAFELLFSQEEFRSMDFITNFVSLLFNEALLSVEKK
jgi:hypothetical protein